MIPSNLMEVGNAHVASRPEGSRPARPFITKWHRVGDPPTLTSTARPPWPVVVLRTRPRGLGDPLYDMNSMLTFTRINCLRNCRCTDLVARPDRSTGAKPI
jgi:hypothetical protein